MAAHKQPPPAPVPSRKGSASTRAKRGNLTPEKKERRSAKERASEPAAASAQPGDAPATPASKDAGAAPAPRESISPVMRESRKRYAPTDGDRMLVMLCKAIGYTDEQIRFCVNIPHGLALNTLKSHFANELETGAVRVNAQVAGNMLRIATKGQDKSAVTAGIFWLKSRLHEAFGGGTPGMSATLEVNGGGKGGKKGDVVDGVPEGTKFSFTLTMGDAPGAPKEGTP